MSTAEVSRKPHDVSFKHAGPWWIFCLKGTTYVPLRLLGMFPTVEEAEEAVDELVSLGKFTRDDLMVGGVNSRD